MKKNKTDILRGWKDICIHLGGMSERKARELITDGMPVKMIAGRPMTTKRALEDWVEDGCQQAR